MTSLIDVIFLLLLFFMLASKFSEFGEIELAAATEGGADADDVQPHFLSLRAQGLLLDGLPVQAQELAGLLAPVPEGPERLVLIGLSQQVTSQSLVDVLAVLRTIGGVRAVVLE